jgi:hypothetical protein
MGAVDAHVLLDELPGGGGEPLHEREEADRVVMRLGDVSDSVVIRIALDLKAVPLQDHGGDGVRRGVREDRALRRLAQNEGCDGSELKETQSLRRVAHRVDRVLVDVVRDLVPEDAGELVVRLDVVEEPGGHVDPPARDRERVDERRGDDVRPIVDVGALGRGRDLTQHRPELGQLLLVVHELDGLRDVVGGFPAELDLSGRAARGDGARRRRPRREGAEGEDRGGDASDASGACARAAGGILQRGVSDRASK